MVRTAAALIATLCLSVPAYAATCSAPSAPEMAAEGAQLSVEEFNALTEGLVAFDGDLKTYRGCLDEILNTPESYTAQEWRAALDAYNAVSIAQSAVYESYDAVSRDFQNVQQKRAVEAARKASTDSVALSQQALATEMAKLNN